MSTKTFFGNFSKPSCRMARGLVRVCAVGLAAAMITSPAQAAFHLWTIREIYTDASGSLQFIELFTSSSGQSVVNSQSISVVGGNTFTLPNSGLAGNTANRALLFGTAGLQAAGGPVPDYIIPNNFLFLGGGTVNFFGANSGPYTALPTDGNLSRTWTGGNAVNSPQNYAGTVGHVVVPEPGALALLGLGLGSLLWLRRKQS